MRRGRVLWARSSIIDQCALKWPIQRNRVIMEILGQNPADVLPSPSNYDEVVWTLTLMVVIVLGLPGKLADTGLLSNHCMLRHGLAKVSPEEFYRMACCLGKALN